MALTSVVLPLPFGPTSPKISPARTVSETPLSARSPPKLRTSERQSRTGASVSSKRPPPFVGAHLSRVSERERRTMSACCRGGPCGPLFRVRHARPQGPPLHQRLHPLRSPPHD